MRKDSREISLSKVNIFITRESIDTSFIKSNKRIKSHHARKMFLLKE